MAKLSLFLFRVVGLLLSIGSLLSVFMAFGSWLCIASFFAAFLHSLISFGISNNPRLIHFFVVSINLIGLMGSLVGIIR